VGNNMQPLLHASNSTFFSSAPATNIQPYNPLSANSRKLAISTVLVVTYEKVENCTTYSMAYFNCQPDGQLGKPVEGPDFLIEASKRKGLTWLF